MVFRVPRFTWALRRLRLCFSTLAMLKPPTVPCKNPRFRQLFSPQYQRACALGFLLNRDSPSNQSLERTRWARSVRFAVRQSCRAAQLQIR